MKDLKKCGKCGIYKKKSAFRKVPGSKWYDVDHECIECERKRQNAAYHMKMQNEYFKKAEQYRRKEKYNRRMKEKYLHLFELQIGEE